MKSSIHFLAASVLAAHPLSAALLAYEGFDTGVYTDGTLSGQGDGSGSGFTGNWKTPVAPFSQTEAASYWSITGGTPSADNFLNASSGQATYQNNFINSTANQVSLQRSYNTPLGGTTSSMFFSTILTIDGSSGVSLGFVTNITTGTDRPFQFGFTEGGNLFARAYGTGPSVSLAISTTTYGPGTYFLVAQVQDSGFVNDSLTLWLNPSPTGLGASQLTLNDATNPANDSNFWVAASGSVQLDGVILDFQSTGEFAGSTSVDDIRIGHTYADVVPEPSSALLGAIGALALLRRRR